MAIEQETEMRTRITATLAAMLLAVGLLAAPAAAHDGHDDGWGPMGPHPHALLLHATFIANPLPFGPPSIAVDWKRCVDLAGGEALPRSNHHNSIHQGVAGRALSSNAGHAVVPYTCEDYPAVLESFLELLSPAG